MHKETGMLSRMGREETGGVVREGKDRGKRWGFFSKSKRKGRKG